MGTRKTFQKHSAWVFSGGVCAVEASKSLDGIETSRSDGASESTPWEEPGGLPGWPDGARRMGDCEPGMQLLHGTGKSSVVLAAWVFPVGRDFEGRAANTTGPLCTERALREGGGIRI